MSEVSYIPGLVGKTYTPTTLTRRILTDFFAGVDQGTPFIGLTGAYGSHGRLEWLAFCYDTEYLVLQIPKNFRSLQESKGPNRNRVLLSTLIESYLTLGARKFIALNADTLAAALHLDMGIRISRLVDAQSIHIGEGYIDVTEESLELLQDVMGRKLSRGGATALWEDDRSKSKACSAGLQRRAWLAQALQDRFKLGDMASINTRLLSLEACISTFPSFTTRLLNPKRLQVIDCVAKIVRENDEMDGRKPTIAKHDFSAAVINRKGQLEVKGARYSTRLKTSGSNQVRILLSLGLATLISKPM